MRVEGAAREGDNCILFDAHKAISTAKKALHYEFVLLATKVATYCCLPSVHFLALEEEVRDEKSTACFSTRTGQVCDRNTTTQIVCLYVGCSKNDKQRILLHFI